MQGERPTTEEAVDMLKQEVEQGLLSPLITEADYQNMITSDSDLSIHDRIQVSLFCIMHCRSWMDYSVHTHTHTQVRVFELTHQLDLKCANLERCVDDLSQKVSTKHQELEECRQV